MLSPELFKIFTDDLASCIPRLVSFAQFADDISIWIASTHKYFAAIGIQQALDSTSTWCRLWRMKLSPTKSISVFFNKCPTNDDESINIYLDGVEVKQQPKCRFLGIILDQKLLWAEYVKDMLNRTKFKVHVLRELANRQGRRHKELLISLFKILITPIFTFGTLCYMTMASTHWEKLNVFHTQSLRSILKIPRHIPDVMVLDTTFNSEYRDTLTKAATSRLKSIMSHSPFRQQLLQTALETKDGTYTSPLHHLINNGNLPEPNLDASLIT